jgi:regulator of RNase E activity RraA
MSHARTTEVLAAGDLVALRGLTTPTVANAIEVFDVQPRTTGFLHPTVRAIVTGAEPMVGYACTAKMRASMAPAPEATANRRLMWEHILSIPAPRVVVVEDLDEQPIGALWGEVQANIHRALGCAGVVTNGGVRDLDEVRALGFQFFAGSVMVSHAYAHIVEVGGPVTVGGMAVRPGDLLHGDQHGVAVVPQRIAGEVPRAAREIEARERAVIDLCRSPAFSVERLDAVFDAYR